MIPFENISLDYKVINNVAYPRIKISGMVRLEPFESGPDSIFHLLKIRVDRSDEVQMNTISHAILTQSIVYYMNDQTYMSSYIFMNDWGDIYNLEEPELIDISSNFISGQYNIVDLDTDLVNEMYIYRLNGVYNNTEYVSSYVAGISHVNIEEDELSYVDPDDVGGLVPINMGLGNVFCSDDIYTIDQVQRIYIKGLPTITTTPRYKGPLDHTVVFSSGDSIEKGIEYLKDAYEEINNQFDIIHERLNNITTNISEFYRSVI